jgi:hypothetical protein
MTRRTLIGLFCFALLPLGCGDFGRSQPSTPLQVTLTVWNKTLHDIEDLRTHREMSYAAAPNLLSENLADNTSRDIQFYSGDRVTAMRRNVDAGKLIAFTTERGLTTPTDGFVLLVFQESFRLVPPPPSDGGPLDGGAPDGGGDADGDSTGAGDP